MAKQSAMLVTPAFTRHRCIHPAACEPAMRNQTRVSERWAGWRTDAIRSNKAVNGPKNAQPCRNSQSRTCRVYGIDRGGGNRHTSPGTGTLPYPGNSYTIHTPLVRENWLFSTRSYEPWFDISNLRYLLSFSNNG